MEHAMDQWCEWQESWRRLRHPKDEADECEEWDEWDDESSESEDISTCGAQYSGVEDDAGCVEAFTSMYNESFSGVCTGIERG